MMTLLSTSNPRMDRKVFMNSFRNGGWEAEESVSDNPFKKGEALRCSLSSNLKDISTCFENETQHTPKRKLGPCPHTGVLFWFIRFM